MLSRPSLAALCLIAVTLTFAATAGAVPPPPHQPPKCYAAQLPGDAAFVLAIRPQQILGRTQTRGASVVALLHEFDEIGGGISDTLSPARSLLDYLGADWNDVVEIAYFVQAVKFPKPPAPADPDEAPRRPARPKISGELILLQMSGPIDQARAKAILRNVTEELGLGKRYGGSGKDGDQRAIFFPDDRTLLIGSETMVRKWIAGKKAEGVLSADLAALGVTDDIAILADCGQVGPLVGANTLPLQALAGAKSAVLKAKILPRISAKLTIETKRAGDAEACVAVFGQGIGQLKEALNRAENSAQAQDPKGEGEEKTRKMRLGALTLMQKGLASLQLQAKEATFTAEWKPEAGLQIADDFTPLVSRDGVAFDPKKAAEKWAARQYRPADSLAAEMQRLLPAAAGMTLEDIVVMANSTQAPQLGQFPDHNLTFAIFCEQVFEPELQKRFPGRNEELSFHMGNQPRPSHLAEVAMRSVWFGYCTLIPFSSVRKIECQEADGAIVGKAQFESPFMYQGTVEFTAKKSRGAWEIVELRWPARGMKFARKPGDVWQATTPLGKWGEPPANRRLVKGSLVVNGKPLVDKSIEFFLRPSAKAFEARTVGRGEFEASLPPGKYVVCIRGVPAIDPDDPPPVGHLTLLEAEVPATGEAVLELKATTQK